MIVLFSVESVMFNETGFLLETSLVIEDRMFRMVD